MDPGGTPSEPRVIKKSQVQVGASIGAPTAGGPSIQIREEGGKVRGLEVHCSCGSKIQIDLEFAAKEE